MRWDEAEGDRVEVELHDSVVVAMHPEDRTLVIRLSPAWVHRSIGVPGRDEGTVWNQHADRPGRRSQAIAPFRDVLLANLG